MNLKIFIPFVLYGVFFLVILIVWFRIRKYLKRNEEIRSQLIRKNRIARNYDVFMNTLSKQEQKELPESMITLGNGDGTLELTLFTSLYCEMCKDICTIVDRIIFAYEDEIKINIFFKKQSSEEKNNFLYILHSVFLSQGTQEFLKALQFWFENSNLESWKMASDYNYEKSKETLNASNDWYVQNGIIATPSVFINGYIYPDQFEKEDLFYHIEGIIENK
ncbi:DsbA family protein [Chryseobacterium carnipullorum]|uniref:DsbA family protein n=1 Tax=Chryseobacterium carnipullorum TaxID=1124835 RepID=UPI000E8097AE|nr:thioredoxin domain-containing protein [Chryseobacterium carnipullorum]HBV14579.1 hypothetical protein [Chryseobacterium carnipullorum]